MPPATPLYPARMEFSKVLGRDEIKSES